MVLSLVTSKRRQPWSSKSPLGRSKPFWEDGGHFKRPPGRTLDRLKGLKSSRKDFSIKKDLLRGRLKRKVLWEGLFVSNINIAHNATMGSTYSQQLTFSHIIYYICWLVLNLALLENWCLDSRRNEEHSYHLWTVAGWSAKLHGLEQFDQRYAAPVNSGEFLPQAVKIPGWHNIIYSLFVFFEMGSVKQRVFFEMGSVKQHVFFEMGSIKQLQTCP